MAEKQSNKERLKEITDSIEAGIQDLFQSEKYMQYLSVMSRFHKYSLNNTMLIYLQKPDASLVAGFGKWKNQFDRHVKKGEHGITIIAPTPFKKKIEEQKLDPDTKAPMLDKDGNIITEEKEIEIPMFRPVKVFDVSQTDGKPLPQLAANLTGDVQNYEVFMEALRRSAPVPMTFEAMSKDTDGYFSPSDQRIAIRTGMSEVQTVSAAVHEIAHSKLHNKAAPTIDTKAQYQEVEIFGQPALFSNGRLKDEDVPDGFYRYDLRGSDDDPGDPICVERTVVVNHAASIITAKPLELPEAGYLMFTEDDGLNFTGGNMTLAEFMRENKKTRNTEEVEAESISYAVCQYYGIQTGENSFGYIATWSKGKELPELKASLETINRTAGELISDIDRNYREICKERGIEAKEQPVPEVTPEPAKAEPSVDEGRWRCYVIPDIMTWNGPAIREMQQEAEKLVGRIDYLGTNGAVGESIEFDDPSEFELEIKDCCNNGVPMSIVLYKDQNGDVMPHDFIFDLDTLPNGLSCVDNPALAQIPSERTPIEFYDSYEDAAARFKELRTKGYNRDETVNPQSDMPYARLTFGIQRENPPSAADLLHVRAGRNYLVDDFTRMEALHTSREVMEVLHRMQEDLGFDRINRYEKGDDGQFLPPNDMLFSEWKNPYFQEDPDEKLFNLDDQSYLHIQRSDDGYDYTIYDVATKAELDGGVLTDPHLSMASAQREISELHHLSANNSKSVPLSTLQPEPPAQKLDEYPVPDPSLRAEDLRHYGYLDADMLPVSKDMAMEMARRDVTIYLLHSDNTEAMAFDADEVQAFEGMFGITHEDWEQTSEFHDKVMDRQHHQQEREQAFKDYPGDCFAIYQVKQEDPDGIRFMGMDWLKSHDIPVDRQNYDLIYTAPLTAQGDTTTRLEGLYEQFNLHHPADYHSPSMSVSDIVAIKQDGVVSCHYTDSMGFVAVPEFMPENALKNAEMSMEDDYGMIDGIINNGPKEPSTKELEEQAKSGQPISLLAYAEAIRREEQVKSAVEVKGKKPSILEKLRATQDSQKKTAPNKSAERER